MLDRHLHLWREAGDHGRERQVDAPPTPVAPDSRDQVGSTPAEPMSGPEVTEKRPHPWARALRMLPGRRGGRR
jgi:hypothetical protein